MLKLKKIILPVDFPNPSLDVVYQATSVARHFQSEIVLLRVMDVLATSDESTEGKLELSLGSALEGLAVRRVTAEGDPAKAILRNVESEDADLIMMPSHGHTFDQFVLGSSESTVIHKSECPIWTSAYVEGAPPQEFALRNVLCAVDFRPHSKKTVSWALQLATDVGARLTLANVTYSVEPWGPGGHCVNPKWKKWVVGEASQRMAQFQREMGIKAETFIGSGDVPKVLGEAAVKTKADLLVVGCRPYGIHLRTHGFAIISAVPVATVCLC